MSKRVKALNDVQYKILREFLFCCSLLFVTLFYFIFFFFHKFSF